MRVNENFLLILRSKPSLFHRWVVQALPSPNRWDPCASSPGSWGLGCEELCAFSRASLCSSAHPAPFCVCSGLPMADLPRKCGCCSPPDSPSASSSPVLHLLTSSPSPAPDLFENANTLGETRCAVMSWQGGESLRSASLSYCYRWEEVSYLG